MLNSFQHQQKQPTTLNPAQLLNGGGMNMNMNSMNGINPAQLMQQQMGGMGSINPAALSAPSPSPQQSQSQSLNINNMLSAVGMSRDQFTSLSHHQQQMVGAKYMAMAQQQHQHQQQQMQMQQGMQMQSHQSIGQSYDRPSSSASSHSQPGQAHMMPPPPPRPPTAQGGMHQQFSAQQGQHISRPGTALSHRSPTIPGPGLAMMDGQRPQSSLSQRDGMNGFKPGQQQQQFNQSQQSASSSNAPTRSPSQQGNLPSPQQQQASQNPSQNANANANLSQIPNPGPNPPYSLSTSPTNRGAKRKATGDVIQGGMGGMGNMSGMGGMGNMGNVGGMGNVGNVGGMGGSMGGMGGGMGSMGGMNMNMNANANAMGMGNMSTMNMGMGVPGSPRIGSGNTMGPPGLPRSISGDNIGGMGMAGMGNMGGGMGGNMGGMGNANMNMMNGARHSPRPQSSMGMSGMGNMGNMNVGGGMGNMNSMGGINNMASMNNMGNMGMGMNVDVPSRMGPQGMSTHAQGMQTGNIGSPQTPMRQGSLPPQTPLPVQQMGMGMGGMPQGSMGPQTPVQAHQAMRQSSVPPSATGGRGSLPPGTGGAMGIGAPSSPLPGIAGPQIAPSMSASSMGSMSGAASATAALPSSAGVTGGAPIGGIGAPGLSASASVSSTSGPSGSVPASASSTGASGLPPLPANVKLNPATTVITTVPLLTSTSAIPALEDEEVQKIKEWMEVDKAYDARLRTMRQRAGEEARVALGLGVGPAVDGNTRNKGWAGSGAIMWWERGAPGNGMGNWNRYRRGREGFDVRYPKVRRDGHGLSRSGRKGAKREGLRLPRKIDPEDANRPEQLVPIRVEFDVEHHKMRDTFVWNLNDPVVTPEAFAQSVVEDYGLASSYHSIIVKSIQDQLSDYNAHMANLDSHDHEGSGVIKGSLDEKETTWWEAWRRKLDRDSGNTSSRNKEKRPHREGSKQRSNKKKRKTTKQESEEGQDDDASMFADNELEYDEDRKAVSFAGDEETDLEMDLEDEFRPLSIDEIKVNEQNMHEDMRILIKLDIIVASIKLDDQFEWDLDNPDASPEEFAEVYTQELGLGGEFKTAIAHSIREQVQAYQKSLFLVGHPSDGSAVQDDELKQSFLPSLISGARAVSEVQAFTPLLHYLSDGELERTEKDRDKDLNKRRKRNTRGRRGIALPDREPIRTYRTPAIGFPELDAATLAAAVAANAPVSRRAAAAAASLTIANMVASENGSTYIPQTLLQQAPQPAPLTTAQKDNKKPKGLFKAPAFPPSVLRPRALVHAPTLSTAADTSNMPPGPVDNEAPRSSSSAIPPPDSRTNKVITAKRAKELEREAKEKEFVDGQHPNYIDGVWHCSNCGCPESIAVGRRKGPLGDKSQCGTCGKYWHRHRRPRPVEYNADPDFHSGLKQKEAEALRTPANKKKGAAAALRALSAANSATPLADVSEPQTPARSNGDLEASSSRMSPAPTAPTIDDDRAMSPVSTASSASEAPLAQKVKMNGANHTKAPAPTPAPPPATPARTQPPEPTQPAPTPAPPAPEPTAPPAPPATPVAVPAATPTSPPRTWPPPWLSQQMQIMRSRYPNDQFEVILRRVGATTTAEWRIKCLDCPGKLYTPGPLETLSNYEVHLKNRQHRQRVNDRLAAAAANT